MLLAAAAALSWLEHSLPPLPFLPPHFRLGVSNVVTMYCFFYVGKKSAASLNALKALFVVFTRGAFAGALSFCGGMAAILALVLLSFLLKSRLSYLLAGVAGALAHNLGQLAAASVAVRANILPAYLPALLVAGVVTGSFTGALLKTTLGIINKWVER